MKSAEHPAGPHWQPLLLLFNPFPLDHANRSIYLPTDPSKGLWDG